MGSAFNVIPPDGPVVAHVLAWSSGMGSSANRIVDTNSLPVQDRFGHRFPGVIGIPLMIKADKSESSGESAWVRN